MKNYHLDGVTSWLESKRTTGEQATEIEHAVSFEDQKATACKLHACKTFQMHNAKSIFVGGITHEK